MWSREAVRAQELQPFFNLGFRTAANRAIASAQIAAKLELYLKLVFLIGVGWYFTGILPTNTNGKLG